MFACMCGVVCRDLKMENIMLDESLRNIKLIGETESLILARIRRREMTFIHLFVVWTRIDSIVLSQIDVAVIEFKAFKKSK